MRYTSHNLENICKSTKYKERNAERNFSEKLSYLIIIYASLCLFIIIISLRLTVDFITTALKLPESPKL